MRRRHRPPGAAEVVEQVENSLDMLGRIASVSGTLRDGPIVDGVREVIGDLPDGLRGEYEVRLAEMLAMDWRCRSCWPGAVGPVCDGCLLARCAQANAAARARRLADGC